MFNAVKLLCKQIDRLVSSRIPTYEPGTLYNLISKTRKVKGRLLYYYPIDQSEADVEDSWIGWHNDSGFLTALTSAMFFDDDKGNIMTIIIRLCSTILTGLPPN